MPDTLRLYTPAYTSGELTDKLPQSYLQLNAYGYTDDYLGVRVSKNATLVSYLSVNGTTLGREGSYSSPAFDTGDTLSIRFESMFYFLLAEFSYTYESPADAGGAEVGIAIYDGYADGSGDPGWIQSYFFVGAEDGTSGYEPNPPVTYIDIPKPKSGITVDALGVFAGI